MADTTSVRKSGRQRVLSKKYTVDAFEGLDILDSDSEENATVWPQLQDTKGDDNYSGEIPSEGEGETLAEKVSDGSVILTPLEDYEDAHSCASSNPEMIANTSKTAKRKVKDRESHREPNFYSRGMPENPMKADSSRISTNILSGSGVEDIRHIVKSRDQWAADPILPRRSKMCPSFTYTEEKRHIEATVGWDWYYDHGGRQFFAERQKIRLLSRDEGIKYTRTLTQSSNRFLMGPYKRQTVFDLLTSQSLDLDQAWNAAATTVTDQQSHPNGTYTKKRRRLGWMLNVGARVRCLDWAPNHDGETQFLALATAQPSNSTPKPPPMEAPAYTPSPSSPSSIQIWALPINATLDIANSVEPIQPPELCLLICTEWGHVSQLKWCPVPRDGRGNHADGKVFIGLLAGIWQDGLARVLDVYLERGQHTVKFDSPAFSACMHGTVSTCLVWLSATDLAIGYSNGMLEIYSIYPDTLHHDTRSRDSAASDTDTTVLNISSSSTPWLSFPLHATYILSLASAYPPHPALIISSSLSGYLRLTSLRAPSTDYVLSARTRTPPSSLAYCDSLLSVVGTEEGSESLRLWGLRCFYSSTACGRLNGSPGPGQGIVDVGKCHSSIAFGGADGSVIITNPMKKVLGRKETGWQQMVFKHEWVRRPDGEGMSRITEGYKVEKQDFGSRPQGKVKMSVVATTHELGTAVTALAWNPSVSCGGWLAVGWGSGLVRIQDMAI